MWVGVDGWSGSIRGTALRSGPTRAMAISGRPRSRTFCSTPCSAAWSTTGPRIVVLPSSSVQRLIPSNQAAHRESRRPWTRMAYRSGSPWPADVWLIVDLVLFQRAVGSMHRTVGTGLVSGDHHDVVIDVVIDVAIDGEP